MTTLEGVREARITSAEKAGPYPFFWDVMKPKEKLFDELFGEEGELSRTKMYEELQEKTKGRHLFSDWLPPKIKLSFVSAFERDVRLLGRTRVQLFRIAAAGYKYRGGVAQQMVDKLKEVSQQ